MDGDGSLSLVQVKEVMWLGPRIYVDSQIEAIFDSIDWNETGSISHEDLLIASSY